MHQIYGGNLMSYCPAYVCPANVQIAILMISFSTDICEHLVYLLPYNIKAMIRDIHPKVNYSFPYFLNFLSSLFLCPKFPALISPFSRNMRYKAAAHCLPRSHVPYRLSNPLPCRILHQSAPYISHCLH